MNLGNFPNLVREGYTVASPADPYYNCIAWAADDHLYWWWPGHTDCYWPNTVPEEDTEAAFVLAFESIGYVECDGPDFEIGFDKVALYSADDGTIEHAAKQVGPDQWSSKIGENEDILHTLEGLEGPLYGTVKHYMKRPTT